MPIHVVPLQQASMPCVRRSHSLHSPPSVRQQSGSSTPSPFCPGPNEPGKKQRLAPSACCSHRYSPIDPVVRHMSHEI
ncbi:hypothetical protein I7I48_01323 [Histoplasma ohiense]|nr:hypothetical protein I7I48_01323 [Histoplasma ohiense (nom. inval.)]